MSLGARNAHSQSVPGVPWSAQPQSIFTQSGGDVRSKKKIYIYIYIYIIIILYFYFFWGWGGGVHKQKVLKELRLSLFVEVHGRRMSQSHAAKHRRMAFCLQVPVATGAQHPPGDCLQTASQSARHGHEVAINEALVRRPAETIPYSSAQF